jgi:hypothetical protein
MKKILLVGWLACTISATSQHFCGTDEYIQKKIAAHPELANNLREMYQRMEDFRISAQSSSRSNKEIIYIPVVFHIIHDGKPYGVGENITDEQVLSQIDALNRDFALLAGDTSTIPAEFKPLAANTFIRFCLAKFDPQGNPTTGIERIVINKTSWNTEDEIETQVKPATIWNRRRYLNIWSLRFGGTLTSSGVLAYATLPYFTDDQTDGIAARFNTIGTVGTLLANQRGGRTIVHEVGHWLGLLHIWGNQPGCYNGSFNTTDFIDDTPDQYDRYFGCPTYPQISCGSSDMFMNHMDYTDDNCRTMFTKGQAEVMYNNLNTGARSSIKTAISNCFLDLDGAIKAILLPTDTICNLNFRPMVRVKNEGITVITNATIFYKIDNQPYQSFPFNKTLRIQEDAFVALPPVSVTEGNHTLTVTFEKPNNANIDNEPSNDLLTVNFYAYDGGFAVQAPFTEDFEMSSFPPSNWMIDNRGSPNTWDLSSASAYDQGFYSAFINNLNYNSNPNGTRDALITDDYDVSQIGLPNLKFDIAYCRVNNNRSDSLAVYYSFDCGKRWTLIYKSGGVTMATAPDQSTFFIPAPNQWKTIRLHLPALVGQNKVRFKFENISGWGNALYLDNINVYGTPLSSAQTFTQKVEVNVYPNPASDIVYVSLPNVHPFSVAELYNAIGQKISSQPIFQRVIEIDTRNIPNGTYFIHVKGEDNSQYATVVINK